MWKFRIAPDRTDIPFIGWRRYAFILSLSLAILSVGLFFVRGLNYGIDFLGGVLIEVQTPVPPDLGAMRVSLNELGLGEVSLQEFGAADDVLIRVPRQPGEEEAQLAAVQVVRGVLDEMFGPELDYRRVELVGPQVGSELIVAGIQAVLFAVLAMLAYIWFRFEWQFGVGAVLALIHDVVLTIGMFALLGIEFNLATVAAILLIIGYSMNDSVVVYDRVRENLRKYKKLGLESVLNRSINDTLSRTLMTSVTTLLALLSLNILGGPVIHDFSFTMIWGILVGTYSSIFVAAPLLLLLHPRRHRGAAGEEQEGEEPQEETVKEQPAQPRRAAGRAGAR